MHVSGPARAAPCTAATAGVPTRIATRLSSLDSLLVHTVLPLASCVSSIAYDLLTTVYRPPRLCPRRASAHRSPAPFAPFLRAHARTVRTRSVLAPAIASRLETFGPAPHRSQDPPARAGAAHGLGRSRAYITLSSFSLSLSQHSRLCSAAVSRSLSRPLSPSSRRPAGLLESLPCCCSWQPGPWLLASSHLLARTLRRSFTLLDCRSLARIFRRVARRRTERLGGLRRILGDRVYRRNELGGDGARTVDAPFVVGAVYGCAGECHDWACVSACVLCSCISVFGWSVPGM